MTAEHPWNGNWKARLYERVRERGYDSLTAFAEAHPTASLVELAETEERGQVARRVRDVLVRELSEDFRSGWPAVLDSDARMEVAIALGRWTAYAPESHQERVRQAGDALLAHPPPAGWRPLGPDDELLRTLLPDEEA